MSKKVNNNGRTNWFKYYFHRFWRLTPTYMFCILFVTKLRPFFGAGPIWFAAADTSACSEKWWTNLLYLNNFFELGNKVPKMCMGHTWYLAADMQMFIISSIFLLIAYRYGLRPLVCSVGVTILASIIVTACLAANDDALPMVFPIFRLNMFLQNRQKDIFRIDEYFTPFKDIYIKPYCRISPYVMGMVLGYILYKQFSKEFKLPWKFVAIMWISAIALALTVVYAPYSAIKEDPHVWTTGERAVFWSLKWSIWGLCIVWLIFACHYNYAGLVKNILVAKFWIPLSHINYAAFIIHFDVIQVLVYNIESPIHFTSFTMVTYFLSALVLTYAIAFIIAVMVELPCANLEALAWKKWEKK
ncbi:nose resistant to fluoxetine 6-like [Paramuricea clavata]|nr:nose resistant to fluoxetine 6-like [Paramuricea clavata]